MLNFKASNFTIVCSLLIGEQEVFDWHRGSYFNIYKPGCHWGSSSTLKNPPKYTNVTIVPSNRNFWFKLKPTHKKIKLNFQFQDCLTTHWTYFNILPLSLRLYRDCKIIEPYCGTSKAETRTKLWELQGVNKSTSYIVRNQWIAWGEEESHFNLLQ